MNKYIYNQNTEKISILLENFLETNEFTSKEKLQIHLFGTNFHHSFIKLVDNEELIAFYYISKEIRMNQKRTLYKASTLDQYIVYDKEKKKVRKSKNINYVLPYFLKKCIKFPSVRELLLLINRNGSLRFSISLLQKLVTHKIKTFSDLLQYTNSYVLKFKELPFEITLSLMLTGSTYKLKFIEDPLNLTKESLTILNNKQLFQRTYTVKELHETPNEIFNNKLYERYTAFNQGTIKTLEESGQYKLDKKFTIATDYTPF